MPPAPLVVPRNAAAPMLQFDAQASDIAADVAIVDPAGDAAPAALSPTTIVIGVDRAGAMPMVNAADFDLLLTAAPQPTRDWIAVDAAEIDAMLEHLGTQVRGFGLPAAVLAQVLRIGSGLPVADALLLESFAYSSLLGGPAFRDWLLKRGPRAMPVARHSSALHARGRDIDDHSRPSIAPQCDRCEHAR